jgi:hypothetical protein
VSVPSVPVAPLLAAVEGLNTTEAARAMGATYPTVRGWRSGRAKTTSRWKAERFAHHLGTTPEALWGDAWDSSAPACPAHQRGGSRIDVFVRPHGDAWVIDAYFAGTDDVAANPVWAPNEQTAVRWERARFGPRINGDVQVIR